MLAPDQVSVGAVTEGLVRAQAIFRFEIVDTIEGKDVETTSRTIKEAVKEGRTRDSFTSTGTRVLTRLPKISEDVGIDLVRLSSKAVGSGTMVSSTFGQDRVMVVAVVVTNDLKDLEGSIGLIVAISIVHY